MHAQTSLNLSTPEQAPCFQCVNWSFQHQHSADCHIYVQQKIKLIQNSKIINPKKKPSTERKKISATYGSTVYVTDRFIQRKPLSRQAEHVLFGVTTA